MKYKAGGELDSVTFSDGKSARYEFQSSGLRANLTYKDKRRVEYTYDPAGNLTSTKVMDAKGKQTAGQVLTLDDSYQLIQQATFTGKIVKFAYDKNGNLTEIREGKSLARFEYDSLNRLVTVITPNGQRLTHDYKAGGQSMVEAYQHAKTLVLDRRDTGLTFGAPAEILSSRPLTAALGSLRFSETLGTFQLSNSEGTEIVTPDLSIEQPLEKLNIILDGTPLQQRQSLFNRPFNPMFIPAEYASINCCPLCTIRPPYCPDCDPPPPSPALTSIDPPNASISAGSVPVTLQGAFNDASETVHISGTGLTASNPAPVNASGDATTTFTIGSGATVGNYNVSVSDSGGPSNSVTFTLLPFINSIEPAMGVVGSNLLVTISGKGFGTAPSLTLGGGITAIIGSKSDTQITATLSIPNNAGGSQSLTVTNQGFSTQGDTFFTQVPTGDRIVQTLTNGANTVCASGQAGWSRSVAKILVDQQAQDIVVQGITVTEFVSPGFTNDFNITSFDTGSAHTNATGQFQDSISFCSSLCPNSTGQTAATQTFQFNPPNGGTINGTKQNNIVLKW